MVTCGRRRIAPADPAEAAAKVVDVRAGCRVTCRTSFSSATATTARAPPASTPRFPAGRAERAERRDAGDRLPLAERRGAEPHPAAAAASHWVTPRRRRRPSPRQSARRARRWRTETPRGTCTCGRRTTTRRVRWRPRARDAGRRARGVDRWFDPGRAPPGSDEAADVPEAVALAQDPTARLLSDGEEMAPDFLISDFESPRIVPKEILKLVRSGEQGGEGSGEIGCDEPASASAPARAASRADASGKPRGPRASRSRRTRRSARFSLPETGAGNESSRRPRNPIAAWRRSAISERPREVREFDFRSVQQDATAGSGERPRQLLREPGAPGAALRPAAAARRC